MVTGAGTSGDPYLLYNLSDLEQIPTLGLNKYYKLANDIDASDTSDENYNSGAGWNPINNFSGDFNGNNKTITGLYINRPNTDNIGFFGSTTGTIYNINIIEGEITGKNNVGGVMGWLNAARNVIDCSFKGNVSGLEFVGGIIGGTPNSSWNVKVSGCYFEGNVTGTKYIGGIVGSFSLPHASSILESNNVKGTITGTYAVGGVAGWCKGHVQNTHLTGVTISQDSTVDYVGGIIGYMEYPKNIIDCSFKGNVSGRDFIGGIMGATYNSNSNGIISGCYFEGNVLGRNSIGGIVGQYQLYGASSIIQLNHVKGTITGTGNNIGGVVGYTKSHIMNSQVIDIVINGDMDNIGGIVGYIDVGREIQDCQVTGNISGRDYIGGIIGRAPVQRVVTLISNCTYNGNVSGRNNVGGIGGNNSHYHPDSLCSTSFSEGSVNGTGDNVGGLFGYISASVENSYSKSIVNGNKNVGGLIGSTDTGKYKNCYSMGCVNGNTVVGGLIGYCHPSSTGTGCFWDIQTSGQSISGLGIGKTTVEMTDKNTYVDWEFGSVWYWLASYNDGYPTLSPPPIQYFRANMHLLQNVKKYVRSNLRVTHELLYFRGNITNIEIIKQYTRANLKIKPINPIYVKDTYDFRGKIGVEGNLKEYIRANINLSTKKIRLELFAKVIVRKSEHEDSSQDFEFIIGDQQYDT